MACTVTLPPLSFDASCAAAKPGQVFRIYHTRATAADVLTDATDLVEWEDRLSQTAVIPGSGAAPIRTWNVIGSWGEAENSQKDLPLGQVFNVPANKTLSAKAYDISPENVAAAIAIRNKGSVEAKIWTEQADFLLGGDTGIDGSLTADIIVPEGRTDLQYIQLTFTTKKSLVEMVESPFPNPFS